MAKSASASATKPLFAGGSFRTVGSSAFSCAPAGSETAATTETPLVTMCRRNWRREFPRLPAMPFRGALSMRVLLIASPTYRHQQPIERSVESAPGRGASSISWSIECHLDRLRQLPPLRDLFGDERAEVRSLVSDGLDAV